MNKKNELERSISHITCTLGVLRKNSDNCEETSKTYNKLLIKRAELRKKLSESYPCLLINMFRKNLKSLNFIKKEKLICDYFQKD
jgi:hypothetical protein